MCHLIAHRSLAVPYPAWSGVFRIKPEAGSCWEGLERLAVSAKSLCTHTLSMTLCIYTLSMTSLKSLALNQTPNWNVKKQTIRHPVCKHRLGILHWYSPTAWWNVNVVGQCIKHCTQCYKITKYRALLAADKYYDRWRVLSAAVMLVCLTLPCSACKFGNAVKDCTSSNMMLQILQCLIITLAVCSSRQSC